MNFKDIKQHTQNEFNIINFNNHEIKILKYLPVEDKFDLIMTAIQKSNINGVYNPIRLDIFFKLNIVYLYTDIEFDLEDRIDEAGLYDQLETSGLISHIMENIEESEMLILSHWLNETVSAERAYRLTAASIISKFIDDLPKNAEAAKDIVDNFDENKYARILSFAKSIEGTAKRMS